MQPRNPLGVELEMVRWNNRRLSKLTEMTTSPSLNFGAMMKSPPENWKEAHAKGIVYKKREGVAKEGSVWCRCEESCEVDLVLLSASHVEFELRMIFPKLKKLFTEEVWQFRL